MLSIVIIYLLSLIQIEHTSDIPSSQCMFYLFQGCLLLFFLNSFHKPIIKSLCEFLITQCVAIGIFIELQYDPNLAYTLSLYGTVVCFVMCSQDSTLLNSIIFMCGMAWYLRTCPCQMQPYTHLTAIFFIEIMHFIYLSLVRVLYAI